MNSKITLILSAIVVLGIVAVLFVLPSNTGSVAGAPAVSSEAEDKELEGETTPVEYTYDMDISTDNYTYKERETVTFLVNLTVPEDMEEALLKVFGVKNKYDSNTIKKNLNVDLKKGTSQLSVSAKLPNCSSCSGVKSGEHTIYAELRFNDTVLANASTTIELKK